jgi:hypothetical protein
MSDITAPETLCKQPSEVRRFQMSFANVLTTGELIVSISSVTSETIAGGVSDLGLAGTGIINGGAGVSVFVSSGTDAQRYRVEFLVNTTFPFSSSPPGQTLEGDGIVKVGDV